MAKVFNGILDGFSGKLGTVVGTNWRGMNLMRAKSHRRRTAVTDKQKIQQLKFGLLRDFLNTIEDVLAIGFKNHANGMLPVNSAFSANYETAITGNYPDFLIDYANVSISRGKLLNGSVPDAAAGPAGTIDFTWLNNSGSQKALANDRAILVAYCESLDFSIFSANVLREAGTGRLNVPDFGGKPVQTWIAFVSEDGKRTSSSVFTGVINVL